MKTAPQDIRIIIADAQPIFRTGLRRALDAEPRFSVVGETGDGEEVVSLVDSLEPNLLLLDPDLARTDGFDALVRIAERESQPSTVLLTASLDRAQLVRAVRLGVRGVVSKDAPSDVVLKALHSVAEGQYWLGREEVADVVRSLLRSVPLPNGNTADAEDLPLTPREREVVKTVVEGLSNREIASRLGVSEDTVKHHLTNVYDKLGVSSRVELVVYAMSHGLSNGD
jgi:DNA-binding NarL/FixJ family response regulator